jgi:cellulose synthase/poly-beta-1,6-N-acetylglucosamine synthase-like glycosyltransferase
MVPNNTGDSPAPVVSIITPAYHAERYIEHTLEAAVMHTFADVGLYIVDDGSTDQMFEIAERYVARDSRIVASRQANREGASSPEKSVSLDPRRMDCRRPRAKQPPA